MYKEYIFVWIILIFSLQIFATVDDALSIFNMSLNKNNKKESFKKYNF
jgi:hypothetical protein